MDLEAPHDDVLTQKDQANTAFLLHGSGLGDHSPENSDEPYLFKQFPMSAIIKT